MPKPQYIVRARDDAAALADALAEFVASVEHDSKIELVDTIGPPGQPHTVIVAVTPELAPAFEQRFRHSTQLMIERDRPLSLYQ